MPDTLTLQDRNLRVARRFIEGVLMRGDMEVFDAVVADAVVVNSGMSPLAPMVGKEAFRQGLRTLAAFSNADFTLEDLIAVEDRVIARYVAHGDHTGPELGVAPTGRRIRMWEIRLMRFKDGQLVEDFVADINYDWPWLIAPAYREAWFDGLPHGTGSGTAA